MKRIISVVLAFIMLTALTGCGKKATDDTTTDNSLSTQTGSEQTTAGSLADAEDLSESTAADSQTETTSANQSADASATTAANQQAESTVTTAANQTNGGTSGGSTSTNELKAYRVEKYQSIFESGEYLISATMDSEQGGKEIMTMAMNKAGDIYAGMEMDGMAMKMLYKANVDKTYMIIDFLKMYSPIPSDMMGEDMDMSSMGNEFVIKIHGAVDVTEVELDNETVICESYTDDKGSRQLFYFDKNDKLLRNDTIFEDGTIDTMNFTEVTGQVDSSYFEFPENFREINISWLMNLIGDDE